MLWLIAHTELLFSVLLIGLVLTVELGLWLRRVRPGIDDEGQSSIEVARTLLSVLLESPARIHSSNGTAAL